MILKHVGDACEWNSADIAWLALRNGFKYGCWCGKGTNISHDLPVVDKFDEICREHDYCWGYTRNNGRCNETHSHPSTYSWSYNDNEGKVEFSIL